MFLSKTNEKMDLEGHYPQIENIDLQVAHAFLSKLPLT